jgi:transposase
MAKQLPLRQCLGIDVSKNTLQVNLSNLEADQRIRVIASTKFDNTSKGLEKLTSWVSKHRVSGLEFKVVMEATGVYHESAAYFLHEKGIAVSVVLPNKSKAYAKSLNAKSKTDSIDARILAQMGLERSLELWQPFSQNMRRIKRLCRERVALQEQKTATLNQLHARSFEYNPEKTIKKRGDQLVKFIEKQIDQVEQDIQSTIASDEILKEKIDRICVVKGLGWVTVVTIIAETDGFALFKNKGQLVSFSGYDVVQHESGTSVKGTTRISKKGNRHI